MKDDNGPLTQMDFKEEDFAILLASGLLADHQVFDVNGKPTFKAHGTSHRTVESKERLTAAVSLCFIIPIRPLRIVVAYLECFFMLVSSFVNWKTSVLVLVHQLVMHQIHRFVLSSYIFLSTESEV